MENLIKRFVKYAKVHTTSNEDSETVPSTEIQKNLGKILVEDLKEILEQKRELNEENHVGKIEIYNSSEDQKYMTLSNKLLAR